MYEHPYFTQTIFAIENEQLVRATERRRAIRERLDAQEREQGTARRMRPAKAARRTAASVARDVTPCVNCPAAA